MNQEQLFSLLQSFASLVSTKNIEWPTSASADEIQKNLTQELISSAHFQSYPPAENYQKSFWKWIITILEEQGEEVSEEIYSHYLSLLGRDSTPSSISIQPPSPSYITYIWRDDSQGTDRHPSGSVLDSCRSCTLFESRTTIESGTTGLRTWTASFVLAEYLVSDWNTLKSSRRILELGSGAGFLGIIIAQLQIEDLKQSDHGVQAYLCLSDLNENVLARCEQNVRLPCNGVSSHQGLHFKALDWSDAMDKSRRTDLSALLVEVNADLILGADVVYDVTIIPSLVATLHLALTQGDTDFTRRRAIIAATLRSENTLSSFTDEVREAKLCIEEIDIRQDGLSACFLRNQPDRIGENKNHVKIFVITNRVNP